MTQQNGKWMWLVPVLLAISDPILAQPLAKKPATESPARGITQPATAPQVPTWPQKFEVQGPEVDSFGFPVTQPGAVTVVVQSQGAPVIVSLQGPAPQPIRQQGTGQVRLSYNVTPQDVQKSVFWRVQVQLLQPMPPQQGGRAGGSVTVQHPPVNVAQVQAAANAHQQAAQQQAAQRQTQAQQAGVQAHAQMEAAFQQRKAQLEQQRQQRQATLMAGVQPALDRMRARGQVGTRGIEGGEAATGNAGTQASEEIGTRALKRRPSLSGVAQSTTASSSHTTVESSSGVSAAAFEGSRADQSGVVSGSSDGFGTPTPPAGGTSTGNANPPPPPPPAGPTTPVITSLSVSQGQPGDPVMITGSGFSGDGGEVHFLIGPGKDRVAPAGVIWRNDQIFATVPDASGVLGFNGTVYVVRASDKKMSNFVAFRFNPALELREIRATTDRVLTWPVDQGSPPNEIQRSSGNFLAGFKDNDVLFGNTRLKNGWVADEAFVYCRYGAGWDNFCDGGAYVWEIKKGTDWPYLNVRWWLAPAPFASYSHIYYSFAVRLIGPKGVPDGLVVP